MDPEHPNQPANSELTATLCGGLVKMEPIAPTDGPVTVDMISGEIPLLPLRMYRQLPEVVMACRMDSHFQVVCSNGCLLNGAAGDWLTFGPDGEPAVVGEKAFQALHTSAETTDDSSTT